jgi:hypothetical protein
MNQFGFILNLKRSREIGRWVEDHIKKCKGRVDNIKGMIFRVIIIA